MLDEKDPEIDRKIAERVITNHKYQNVNSEGALDFLNNNQNSDYVIEPKM